MSFILKRQDLHKTFRKMFFWYLKIIADRKGTNIEAFVNCNWKKYFRTNCYSKDTQLLVSFTIPEEKYKHIWATDKLSIKSVI